MNIKKGDILYKYAWHDRSDKNYCSDELTCVDDKGNECPNYKKCLMQPQKLILTKVTITRKSYYDTWDKSLKHYNAVDLKNWREPVGNFRNTSHYKTKVKISPRHINEWAKSESGALRKVNQRLKAHIKTIRKSEKSWYLYDQRNIKNFIALQEKLEIKIKESK